MNSRKLLLVLFVLVALVQLYVPASMIRDSENVLEQGTEYMFKTAPIDPHDPFRGKYITLSYEENTVKVADEKEWTAGETVFVLLTTDSAGFARIASVSKERPYGDQDFVKATVDFVTGDSSNMLSIQYPFERFYMEESKAYDAELTYRESQGDTTKVTYALVSVKDGDAVLRDVLINGVPIREIVRANQERDREKE